MKCAKPFRDFGCGQCLPCRLNRRRLWTCRIMLEAAGHDANSFWTMTYDQEHLPVQGVQKRDLQLFFKKLRLVVGKFRYYAVGEYGENTQRPHYHVVLFGVGTDRVADVLAAWGNGFVYPDAQALMRAPFVGSVTEQSAAYVASYTVKRMTRVSDPRLAGRNPEFALMSLKPGIGAGAGKAVADAMLVRSTGELRGLDQDCDVPGQVRVGGRLLPLGRYLREQVRKSLGWKRVRRDVFAWPRQEVPVMRWAVRRREEMSVPGARQLLEEQRLQSARKAKALFSISRSRKGIGV